MRMAGALLLERTAHVGRQAEGHSRSCQACRHRTWERSSLISPFSGSVLTSPTVLVPPAQQAQHSTAQRVRSCQRAQQQGQHFPVKLPRSECRPGSQEPLSNKPQSAALS